MNDEKILVVGSLAYDHVMTYDGLFQDGILAEHLDHLSVTFTTDHKLLHFGGCGANIAYTLKLLGVDPVLMGLIGKDSAEYMAWLKKNKIGTSKIVNVPDTFTACAYILTDRKGHQITIFHAGAMDKTPESLSLVDLERTKIGWAIIAPDDHRRMVRLARECFLAGVRYIFDPGQQILKMKPSELLSSIKHSSMLIFNEYEGELLCQQLELSKKELCNLAPLSIETLGEKGARVFQKGSLSFTVAAVKPLKVVDPTGCGDAFRAGLLAGLIKGLDIEKSCQMGTLAATYALENQGTQNHAFTLQQFEARLKKISHE